MKFPDLPPDSFENWLTSVFNHNPDTFEETYEDADQEIGDIYISAPAILVAHVTRMCSNFIEISQTFSLEQIDTGIWFLFGAENEFGACLADVEIPLTSRIDCIRSMYRVYADFVALSEVEEMINGFDMWWDLLLSDFWGAQMRRIKQTEWEAHIESLLEEGRKREDLATGPTITYQELEATEKQVVDAMFETLKRILALEDARTQSYALHGLGHLHHSQVPALVQNFIDTEAQNWDLDESGLKWLESCRDGTVM